MIVPPRHGRLWPPATWRTPSSPGSPSGGGTPTLAHTGFHPLDGARHLTRLGWPHRIAALVAHHSGAIHLARLHDLETELNAYPRESSPLADALTHADQITGPTGQRVTLDERIAEATTRHRNNRPDEG